MLSSNHVLPTSGFFKLLFNDFSPLIKDALWSWVLTVAFLNQSVSSVAQLCRTLCNPHGLQHARLPCPSPTPGARSNACPLSRWYIQPFHPLLSSSPLGFNLSQHQGLSQWVSYSNQAPKYWSLASSSVLPMNIQGWFPLGLTGLILLSSWEDSQESSPAPQFKSINSLVLSLLYSPTLTSVDD